MVQYKQSTGPALGPLAVLGWAFRIPLLGLSAQLKAPPKDKDVIGRRYCIENPPRRQSSSTSAQGGPYGTKVIGFYW